MVDGSFYFSYDLNIYCHDGFFYKPPLRVFAYLEIFAPYTLSNHIYKYLTNSPKMFD